MNTFGHKYRASPPASWIRRRAVRVIPSALLAVTTGLFGTGCSRVILSTDDAIVRDDGRTTLVANVERERVRDVRQNLANVKVRFVVGGQNVGQAMTDDDGRAALEATLAPGVTEFVAIIKHEGVRHQHQGRAFHWRRDRTIVAVDIDETVSDTSYRVLLFRDEDNKSDPLKDSSAILSRIAQDFQVVYLTGRPRFLWEKTRRWLDRHGFPAGPVVTAPSLRQCILQGIFKRTELAELRKNWPGALIGIGDRGVDINAYQRNGMLTLLIGGDDSADVTRNLYRFGKWLAIGEFWESNRTILSDPELLESALKSGAPFQLPIHMASKSKATDPLPPDAASTATDTK